MLFSLIGENEVHKTVSGCQTSFLLRPAYWTDRLSEVVKPDRIYGTCTFLKGIYLRMLDIVLVVQVSFKWAVGGRGMCTLA